jgi:D-lyxose ketol-isomerase
MIMEDHQVCLFHFHWDKVEDIINRGGGKLKLQFYQATETMNLTGNLRSLSTWMEFARF